ncbi:GNAT family N-acetyltransferase [Salinibacterium sp. SYSU T00001]|uniref:GNAT family N-acetyltransferase n=1 Tax=Homoserinimonas sedimenticola TaxID=2986805 RepID=UPI0022368E6D|nr:GNAT family N-acetyltransferase [Salinibacterium sedimenticola]MCW4384299.1 GNAT family N-acetyltransferase [Salinibacterium sedimenticola]
MSTTAATSATEVAIRRASSADADGVFALVAQLSETYDVERSAFDAAFEDAVEHPTRNVLLVAENGDRILGYALMTVARLMYTRADAAQIQELIVDEGHRGLGIGSRLVWAVEDICLELGLQQLTVASSRAPAFYDRLDFRSTADYLKKVFRSE